MDNNNFSIIRLCPLSLLAICVQLLISQIFFIHKIKINQKCILDLWGILFKDKLSHAKGKWMLLWPINSFGDKWGQICYNKYSISTQYLNNKFKITKFNL